MKELRIPLKYVHEGIGEMDMAVQVAKIIDTFQKSSRVDGWSHNPMDVYVVDVKWPAVPAASEKK